MAAPALRIPVSASTDQLERDMQRAQAATRTAAQDMMESFRKANDDITSSTQAAGNKISLILGTAVVAAAVGIATRLHSVVGALADIGDRAEDLRLPVNLLQALSVAAGQARVPIGTLNTALDQFSKVSKQDTDDGEKFYKALGNIGQGFVAAFKDAPSQAERLRIISDALKSTTDEVKRAQLAQQAFGTDNERLIAIFSGGRDAIQQYIEQVRRLGLEINEGLVRQAQEAKSQISLFSRVLTDEFSSSLAGLIPIFVRVLPYIEKLGAVVRDMIVALAAGDNEKPLESLKSELSTLETQMGRLQETRDRLTSANQTTLDSLRDKLRAIIGFEPVNLKEIDGDIADTQQRIDAVKKLIENAQKTRAGQVTAGQEPGAFQPRPSLAGQNEDAFDRATSAVARHIASLQADAAAIGLTTAAHERLRAEMRLLEAARQSDVKITDEQMAAYANLRSQGIAPLQALQAAGINLTEEQAKQFANLSDRMGQVVTASTKAKTAFEGLHDSLKFAGNQLVDVIDRATQKGAKFGDIMADVLRNISKELLRAAITGEGAFAKILGTASNVPGGTGGILGILAKSIGIPGVGGGANPFSPGAGGYTGEGPFITGVPTGNAGGTDYWRGGPTWVGENGPEIVNIPKGAQIVPNDIARNGGAGVSVAIHNMNDFRGADPSMRAFLLEQLDQRDAALRSSIVPTIIDARRRSVRI